MNGKVRHTRARAHTHTRARARTHARTHTHLIGGVEAAEGILGLIGDLVALPVIACHFILCTDSLMLIDAHIYPCPESAHSLCLSLCRSLCLSQLRQRLIRPLYALSSEPL